MKKLPKRIFLVLSLGIMTTFFVACSQEKNTEEGIEASNENTTPEEADEAQWKQALENMPNTDTLSLDKKLLNLKEDIRYHWGRLMASGREKDDMLQKLIREAGYIEGFEGQELLEQVETKRKELSKLQYDSITMQNPTIMDGYDKKLSEIQKVVTQIKERNPEIERYPIPNEAITYFINIENNEFLLRNNYVRKADELNQLLMSKKDEIAKLGEQFIQIKPAPVFKYGDLQ